MKKLFTSIILISILCLIGCNPTKDMSYGVVAPANSLNIGIDTFNIEQLDSMILADQLPSFKDWNKSYIKDVEDNKAYEYDVLYDPNSGIIYTVKVYAKDIFVVLKRQLGM